MLLISAAVNLKSKCNGSIDPCKPACEHHDGAETELAGNLNCIIKSSSKFESRKVISLDDGLAACGISGEAGTFEKGQNVCSENRGEASKHPSLELDECDYASSESAEIIGRNNLLDLHRDNSSALHRRKTRKVRLLTELLCENGDGDTNNVRTDDSLSNAIPDASAVGDKLHVTVGQVAVSGNVRRSFSQHRKRKLDQDEDWRPMETGSPIKASKEAKILKRDLESTDAIEKAFARMHLQTSLKNSCTKRRIDGSPSMGKKKNKKSLILNESSSLALIQENVPNGIGNKTGDASTSNAADGVMIKPMHNEVIGREADVFPLSTQDRKSLFKKKSKMPQVDDPHASLIPWNHGMLKEDLISRKDVDFLQSEPLRLPFHSVQDTSSEKGLNLSLNSYLTKQKYDMRHNLPPQVEERRMSLITQQEGTAENLVNRNAAETKSIGNFNFASKSIPDMHYGKGVYSGLSSKRTINRMPFLNEKQNCTSQFDIGNCSHMQQKVTVFICLLQLLQYHGFICFHDLYMEKDKHFLPDIHHCLLFAGLVAYSEFCCIRHQYYDSWLELWIPNTWLFISFRSRNIFVASVLIFYLLHI